MMGAVDLVDVATALPEAWQSRVMGQSGNASIKILRMDGSACPEEVHSYNEALLVLQGRLELMIAGCRKTVQAGELLMVEANCRHAVCQGSEGVLLIVDAACPRRDE